MVDTCYATEGLLDALCSLAADREPEAVSTQLLVTPAGELEPVRDPEAGGADGAANPGLAGLDPATPVFTDFYVPSAARSVDAVFGVDVSIPHGQAQGRFVSHPLGELSVTKADDLAEVVLVAVPPWRREDLAAFDRRGSRLQLVVLAAAPPERPFEG